MSRLLNIDMINAMYKLGGRCLVVYGLFGGGKTRTVMQVLLHLVRHVKVIYAAPLRKLRDWMYYYFKGKHEIERVRSKIETCPTVSMFVREEDLSSPLEYMYSIIKICSECRDVKLGKCVFFNELRMFRAADRGFFTMTHNILYVLGFVCPEALKNSIVVIDEADEYFDLFKLIATQAQIEEITRLARRDRIWRKVLQRLHRSLVPFGSLYFARPCIPVVRTLILISATLRPELFKFVPLEGYSIYYTVVKSEIHDICSVYPKILIEIEPRTWKPNYVRREEWIEDLLNVVIKLYDEGKTIGIACRNYSVNRVLCSRLRELGARVFSDVLQRDPPPFNTRSPCVVVWTTRGKWYRGVSLPDADVIFCTYQTASEALSVEAQQRQISPNIMSYVAADRGLDVPYVSYSNVSSNAQSYYRANRIRSKSHHMVFLDLRAHTAVTEALAKLAQLDREFKEWYTSSLLRPHIIGTLRCLT